MREQPLVSLETGQLVGLQAGGCGTKNKWEMGNAWGSPTPTLHCPTRSSQGGAQLNHPCAARRGVLKVFVRGRTCDN